APPPSPTLTSIFGSQPEQVVRSQQSPQPPPAVDIKVSKTKSLVPSKGLGIQKYMVDRTKKYTDQSSTSSSASSSCSSMSSSRMASEAKTEHQSESISQKTTPTA